MANLFAIHSVGNSLATYLAKSYPEELRADHPCAFTLLSSGELNKTDDPPATVSLFLYRVTMQEHLRNGSSPSQAGGRVPLAVDLHYLLTVWASSALTEQIVLAWTMRELHQHPILDASSLSPEAGWGNGETVQLIPSELSTEEMMQIWDALEPPYHLSTGYLARVVRIDLDVGNDALPVVATRHEWSDR